MTSGRVCQNSSCRRPEEGKKGQTSGYLSENDEWYCSYRCYVEDLADRSMEQKKRKSHQTIWKMQLGLLLLKRNLIDQGKLNQALMEKNRSGRRIGEILLDSGHITENDLKKALSIQAGVAPITIDPGKPVYLDETIPERFYFYFNMTVFNISHDEKIIYVAVGDIQDLSYLKLFFDKIYSDYLIKYYLDSPDNIRANLSRAFSRESESREYDDSGFVPIKDQQVEPVILSFLQFLDHLGGRNTRVDHLDQSLWVRSDLEGHRVDIYFTPKGKM